MTEQNGNVFTPAVRQEQGALISVEQERAMAEIQAQMVVAKRFPRDQNRAYLNILESCKRKSLAEQAEYVYPRGGSTVTGPTIRLAEVLAQNWGNMTYGLKELSQRPGESDVEAYAWDLETNVRVTRSFVVKHQRKARGAIQQLTDPRDIYEMAANQGQRRVRACILEVIPGDIVESAIIQCNKTLAGSSDEPIADRVRVIVEAFAPHGVTPDMIEERLGHKLDAIIEPELVVLRKVFQSLKDGMGKREDFFKMANGGSKSPKEDGPKEDGKKKENQMGGPAQKAPGVQEDKECDHMNDDKTVDTINPATGKCIKCDAQVKAPPIGQAQNRSSSSNGPPAGTKIGGDPKDQAVEECEVHELYKDAEGWKCRNCDLVSATMSDSGRLADDPGDLTEDPPSDKEDMSDVPLGDEDSPDNQWWNFSEDRNGKMVAGVHWRFRRAESVRHIVRIGFGMETPYHELDPVRLKEYDKILKANPTAFGTLLGSRPSRVDEVRKKYIQKAGYPTEEWDDMVRFALGVTEQDSSAPHEPDPEEPPHPADDTTGEEDLETLVKQVAECEEIDPDVYALLRSELKIIDATTAKLFLRKFKEKVDQLNAT